VGSSRRVSVLWFSFLLVWALTQLFFGAVRPWAICASAIALALLNLAAIGLLPNSLRLSKVGRWFLFAAFLLFLVQFLPLAPLVPYTTALRGAHGTGGYAPATADLFLTLRSLVQFLVYVLSALLVLRLVQAGLGTDRILKGICGVLVLQALYAMTAYFGGFHEIPFFGERPYSDSASGTLVNRNSFAGMMGMGCVAAAALALSRRGRFLEKGVVWAAVGLLFVICIVLSKSRGGAISTAAGFGIFFLLLSARRKNYLKILGVVVLGMGTAILANVGPLVDRFREIDPREISSDARWVYAKTTLEAAAHQPVLGFGVGTHPRAYHPFQPPTVTGQLQHAHNEYVNAIFEGGPFWLLILLAGLGAWYVRVRSTLRKVSGPGRVQTAAAIGAVGVVVVHSFIDFDLRITSIGMLFSVFIAMGTWARPAADRVRVWIWAFPSILALATAAALLVLPLDPEPRIQEAMKVGPERAEELCRKALALSPYDYRAAWMRARAAQAMGDEATADRRYALAADLWPAHFDLQRDTGLWFWEGYRESRDPDQLERSARCFQRVFAQSPWETEEVLKEIWDPAFPATTYEKLLPRDPLAVSSCAGFLARRGYWKEAMGIFDRGCPEVPENTAAYDHFAWELAAAGQWGLEATVLERRLGMKADGAAYAEAARAWNRLGLHDKSLEYAETATRIEPAKGEWWALLGDLLWARGRRVMAVNVFSRAVDAEPGEISYRLRRGELYLRLKVFEFAAVDFRKVLSRREGHREATLGLARALVGTGDKPAAVGVLERWILGGRRDQEVEDLLASLRE
jgi:tetratricopeptide (TPR) repeat protein/O-antigen ligase